MLENKLWGNKLLDKLQNFYKKNKTLDDCFLSFLKQLLQFFALVNFAKELPGKF